MEATAHDVTVLLAPPARMVAACNLEIDTAPLAKSMGGAEETLKHFGR